MATRSKARQGIDVVATALRAIGLTIVAILAVHVVLTVFEANPDNGLARLIRTVADIFDLGLADLFVPDNPKLAVALNYGTAALIWFILTSLVVRVVRRGG